MSDLVRIAQGLYAGSALDDDDELEVNVGYVEDLDNSACTWLTRREILALITHLGKVLDDADEKQETER